MSAALTEAGTYTQRLTHPRKVRLRGTGHAAGRPAVLLGWIVDQHGRRLWAEIVTHSQFVRPDDIEEDA